MIKIIRTGDRLFDDWFARIYNRGKSMDEGLLEEVRRIVQDVAEGGDEALFAYTKRFDGLSLTARTVSATRAEIGRAARRVPAGDRKVLELAAERIERYHRRQEIASWVAADEEGIELGQRVLPLERVGIYAPGGRAVYPSTVLMAAVTARIAGVRDIVLATPARDGRIHPLIAAAASIGGVSQIFKIGGAQAIAALAYGTASIPAVDKIVGPGNAYVAAAKKLVFGQVAIDMIAGPSEVLIIADGSIRADRAAADLLAQAEHDVMASAVLLTPREPYAREVAQELERQLPLLSRRAIASQSLDDYGALVITQDMGEALTIANRFAPEHLELLVADHEGLVERLTNAGAIFLGGATPEALGDYIAGPNHILPTGGTARFSSPLGVYDFVKRTSILNFSPEALGRVGRQASRLAEMEGFDAHGRSITLRMKPS